MSRNKYAAFYAALKASQAAGNPHSKEEVVSQLTNNRTSSLSALSFSELSELVSQLTMQARKPDDKGDKMRKAIIAIFYDMQRDAKAAKEWCEKQGVKGQKKAFNHYTNGELFVLVKLAEKVRSDWKEAIRKKIQE